MTEKCVGDIEKCIHSFPILYVPRKSCVPSHGAIFDPVFGMIFHGCKGHGKDNKGKHCYSTEVTDDQNIAGFSRKAGQEADEHAKHSKGNRILIYEAYVVVVYTLIKIFSSIKNIKSLNQSVVDI